MLRSYVLPAAMIPSNYCPRSEPPVRTPPISRTPKRFVLSCDPFAAHSLVEPKGSPIELWVQAHQLKEVFHASSGATAKLGSLSRSFGRGRSSQELPQRYPMTSPQLIPASEMALHLPICWKGRRRNGVGLKLTPTGSNKPEDSELTRWRPVSICWTFRPSPL